MLFLYAFFTAIIETPIVTYILRKKESIKYLIIIGFCLNIATNLLLNAFILPWLLVYLDYWIALLISETIIAYLAEAIAYHFLIRDLSFKKSLLLSILVNTITLSVGIIVSTFI